MNSLKKMVQRNLLWLAAILMIVILFLSLFFQIMSIQSRTRENADAMFVQVNQIIEKNSKELQETQQAYRDTCIMNTQAISYVIENNPSIIGDVEEFILLAKKLEVDEIHIFDDTGRIFTGTHPEYFNYTFDSGEQINFFKPLLTDKSLTLCQDITPNTAENKLVQYSAAWSTDGKYIVQVGMYPDAVLEVTEKNELSYIFSLLRGNPGVSLYAVNASDGTIIGSTSGADNNKKIGDIGIPLNDVDRFKTGAHCSVNGVNSYCIIKNIDGTLIGYVISNDHLYSSMISYSLILAACLFVIALVLVLVVKRYTNRYIVGSIAEVNNSLRVVADGNLDERVDVQSCLEFSELSSHINYMIKSLLADTDKMSEVLNRTNLKIGVYEYNTNMKTVRFTEHIPEIFNLNPEEVARLSSDNELMQEFIECVRQEPLPDAENTYHFAGKGEMYLKLEEIKNDNTVLGVAMDVTEEIATRMRAESERDHDLMTGLYNRRGMERAFEELFKKPESMGCGAVIMIDCDNLKVINDTYGHAAGDGYLKYLADVLNKIKAPKLLSARIGGDEFVLLIYGYETDEQVLKELSTLRNYQDKANVKVDDGIEVPLYFSYGYELTCGRADYNMMLSTADSHMYNSKRMRKKAYRERTDRNRSYSDNIN